MSNISPTRIREIVKGSLYTTEELPVGEVPPDAVIADGVVNKFGFHPQRLAQHREEVIGMLKELNENFYASKGGGWSFLNLPMDKYENQWGEQQDADFLLTLGIGLGLMKILLPRDMWDVLPGGVPYVAVNDEMFVSQ